MSQHGRFHWIKLYVEMNYDPKIGLLPDDVKWRFVSVLLLAGERNEDGFLPEINDMAWLLRTNPETLAAQMRTLAHRGLVELRMHPDGDERWFVSQFAKRQSAATSTERSQKMRKAAAAGKKPSSEPSWRMKIYKALPHTSGVYMISFTGTGKAYIGSSKDIQRRVQAHLTEMATLPDNSMGEPFKAVGPAGIVVKVLEEAPVAELPERETEWLRKYGSRVELLNTESAGKHHHWRNDSATNSSPETETETEQEPEKEGESGGQRSPAKESPPPPPEPAFVPVSENLKRQKARAGVQEPPPTVVPASPRAVQLLAQLTSYQPGADVEAYLAGRLGESPDETALRRAVELWRASGYRPNNFQGMCDWYDELRRDPTWTPGKKFSSNGAGPNGSLAEKKMANSQAAIAAVMQEFTGS